VRSGTNDLDHGFRLGQINTAVEEGSTSKFPGLSQPCSGFQHQLKDVVEHTIAAVAVDFYHVLASVGAGCRHIAYEDFVESLGRGRFNNPAVIKAVGFDGLNMAGRLEKTTKNG